MRDRRMEASMNAWREETMSCQETTACHEEMEANSQKIEPDPGMMQSVGEHQEVPKKEAAGMPFEEPRKQRRKRNLAAECSQKLKERTRGYGGSQN
jgi:hypothetical protein